MFFFSLDASLRRAMPQISSSSHKIASRIPNYDSGCDEDNVGGFEHTSTTGESTSDEVFSDPGDDCDEEMEYNHHAASTDVPYDDFWMDYNRGEDGNGSSDNVPNRNSDHSDLGSNGFDSGGYANDVYYPNTGDSKSVYSHSGDLGPYASPSDPNAGDGSDDPAGRVQ